MTLRFDMNKQFLKTAMAASIAATVLLMGSSLTQAASYSSTQDTYIYQFLGNQGPGTGDSGGISVWNHESVHGAQALVQFDSNWANDAAVLSGNYTATLNLYSFCETAGFVGACAGEAAAVTTDVVLQGSAWLESDSGLGWGNITQASTPSASFTQTSIGEGWISVDITNLVDVWVGGVADNGLALTQEAYSVIRNANNTLTVSQFCDSESSNGFCATGSFSPYLEISAPAAVPVPAAAWLFGSALLGLAGIGRNRKAK
jgi:hypothetical protein